MEFEIGKINFDDEVQIGEIEVDYKLDTYTTEVVNVVPSEDPQTIFPSEADAISQVNVEPISDDYVKPSGTLEITTNGVHNVKKYNEVNVNVGNLKINDAFYLFSNEARMDVMNELVAMLSDDCERFSYMFNNCKSLINAPHINTKSCTNSAYMFSSCSNLISVPLLDFGNNTSLMYMFSSCSSLTTLGGFKDLGKAYLTTTSANNNGYRLDLSSCTKLTHDSLMNVINNLYDIASKGCNTQSLKLSSASLSLLTADEIAIATNKGWTIS